MNAKGLALGTLVGALALTAAGYVVFGLAFPRFYTDFMNAGSATGVARQPFLIWPAAVAMLSYALLLTLVIATSAHTPSVSGGMRIGALVSFLLWFTADFMLYGISNVGSMVGTFIDPVLEAGPGAVAGGVIAVVLTQMGKSRADERQVMDSSSLVRAQGKTDIVQRMIAIFIAAVSMGATADAQAPATTFAELPNRLAIGETVFVTNQSAQTVKGKVQQVSDTILLLRTRQDDLTLAAPDVRRIARRGHTLRNGALTGLVAGFATGAIVAEILGCSNFFCPARNSMAIGGISGSIGMGVGAAVGAALRRERVVFDQAANGRAPAAITPLLSLGGAGLLAQVRW